MNDKVPRDLEDAIQTLERELSPEDLERLQKGNPEDFHRNLGLCIRNNWKLWAGSRLAWWFKTNHQIDHPDDVSNIIITSLQRKLNGVDVKLDEQIASCKNYWAGVVCTKEEVKLL